MARITVRSFAVLLIFGAVVACFAGGSWVGAAAMGVVGLLLWAATGRESRTSWRSDRATERQKEFADELGIHYQKNITKGDLSDLISEVTGR